MSTMSEPISKSKPVPFSIDASSNSNTNILYYNSKELNDYDPVFYYGCKTKPRNIISKKNIPESDYIYANLKSKEWNISSADCKKAQLLISQSWVDKHFFKMVDIVESKLIIQPQENNIEEDVENIEEAPKILLLKDSEKFCDNDGNIFDIETRGEKNRNKVFFKVKDVSKCFEMNYLDSTILQKDKGYHHTTDYKTFFIRKYLSKEQPPTIKKCLYLTYHGLLRVLFVSRNKNVKRFQDWAEENLFTIQMGTKEEKMKLSANILNVSPKNIRAVFETYANKFPCIYLLCLGKVKDLRETFNIDVLVDGELNVYKYGFTDDLGRRIGEHDSKYGKMKNVVLTLSTFHIIDAKYTSEAEHEIREICNAFEKKLNVDGFKELIALNDKEFVQIKKQYKYIGNEFAGATLELQSQITELKEKIKEYESEIAHMKIVHKNELLEKDMMLQREIHEKNNLKSQLDTNQIIFNLEKQNYILQLQLVAK
jgi:hypothetical protein